MFLSESNSYGVKTKYKVNKKWGLSSGLKKINELIRVLQMFLILSLGVGEKIFILAPSLIMQLVKPKCDDSISK